MEKNKALHKLKGLPPIYVINLDDKEDRWKYMEDQFRYWEVEDYQRVSAYDGRGDNDLGEILKGRYPDTTRQNFLETMDISCFSFTNVARRATALMGTGGSLITLSYLGSVRTIPNYNVMGVAKAALEASVRYLAADLGPRGIRVNALSPGPMRTLAGSAIADARYVYRYSENNSPLARNIENREVGDAGIFLASNLSSGVTGEVHYVDGGMRIVGIPKPVS